MISGFLNSITPGSSGQDSVETVVSHIVSHSDLPEGLTKLASFLKSREAALNRNKGVLPQALSALDPASQSLGYLHLLSILLPAASPAGSLPSATGAEESIYQVAEQFVSLCASHQVQISPEKFVHVVQALRDRYFRLRYFRRAISLLRIAINKIVPGQEYITPLHADCFQACLMAKCYREALPLLATPPEHVDPAKTAMTPRSFLLYCYYGAMIHIGRKTYADALRLLLHALTAPTFVVNAITLAAHAKYVLVCLIHTGAIQPLPKFTSPSVSRAAKLDSSAYLDLANAYKDDGSWTKAVNQHHAAFKQDGNWGLVQLAGESRAMRRIQRLTQTYLTLSLHDIAATAGLASPQQAQLYLLRMIDAGEIFAQIDEAAGMVRFLEDPQQYSSSDMASHINSQVQRAQVLANKLKALNAEVSCEKAYQNKIAAGRERHTRAPGFEEAGDFATASEFNFNLAGQMLP